MYELAKCQKKMPSQLSSSSRKVCIMFYLDVLEHPSYKEKAGGGGCFFLFVCFYKESD